MKRWVHTHNLAVLTLTSTWNLVGTVGRKISLELTKGGYLSEEGNVDRAAAKLKIC